MAWLSGMLIAITATTKPLQVFGNRHCPGFNIVKTIIVLGGTKRNERFLKK